MAEKAENKFAKMMQTVREQQTDADQDEAQPTPEIQAPAKTKAAPSKARGRPTLGKRSDPDYETTTVFLRRDTKLAAARLLIGDKDQDLSDVLEKLLSTWVRKNS